MSEEQIHLSFLTQFSMRRLFRWVGYVALMCMPAQWFGPAGIILGGFIVGCVIGVRHRIFGVALVSALLGIIAMFSLAVQPRERMHRAVECANNLRQIGLAIGAYEMEHGHLPPPYTVDAAGNPLHSWRVLILPYLEEGNLYRELDLTRPWNDPVNLRHQERMPDVFQCPSHRPQLASDTHTTAYVAVVGESTAWPSHGVRTIREVLWGPLHQDVWGPASTIAVLESEPDRLHWMAPHDPTWEHFTTRGENAALLPEGLHARRMNFVRCDHTLGLFTADQEFAELIRQLQGAPQSPPRRAD